MCVCVCVCIVKATPFLKNNEAMSDVSFIVTLSADYDHVVNIISFGDFISLSHYLMTVNSNNTQY